MTFAPLDPDQRCTANIERRQRGTGHSRGLTELAATTGFLRQFII